MVSCTIVTSPVSFCVEKTVSSGISKSPLAVKSQVQKEKVAEFISFFSRAGVKYPENTSPPVSKWVKSSKIKVLLRLVPVSRCWNNAYDIWCILGIRRIKRAGCVFLRARKLAEIRHLGSIFSHTLPWERDTQCFCCLLASASHMLSAHRSPHPAGINPAADYQPAPSQLS